MRAFWRNDHTIRLSLLGLFLTLLYLTILIPIGFIQDARSASSDSYLRWRKKLFPPPRETQELLIVTVDDESQRTLNQKWPWDRTVFAEFLRRISAYSPKGVLFDFAFQGTSRPESDNALAQAIETAPPTFLAAYLDPKGNLMLPQARFIEAGGMPGLINKPLDPDQRIRRARGIIYLQGQMEPLLAIEARGAALLLGTSQDQIQWERFVLNVGPKSIPTNWLGQFPINYLASTPDFQTVSFWKILRNSIDSDQIRGKLVIVGTTQEITHDMHPTPLGRLSGIVIEGNVILNFLTGRSLKMFPLWAALPLALLFVIGIQQLSYRTPLPTGFLIALLTTGLAIGAGLALSCLDILAEFVSPMVLGGAAWLSGFLYKYLVMASGTLRLQRQAVTDNITGAFTNRYFQLRLQEELRQFHWVKRPASLILVQVASTSHLLQHQPWEEVKRFLSSLVQTFKGVLTPQSFIGILQEGRFGLFLPNTPLSKAEEIVKKLQGSISSTSGISTLSLASTEQCPSRAGNALLRCAEAALSQALSKGSRMEVYSPTGGDASPKQGGSETEDSRGSTNLDLVSSELEERNLALEKALTELRQVHQQLESSFLEVTKTLILALETKDTYTAGHLERVSRYSTRLAEVLHLPKEEVEAIREAALLHDIGKIGLPDEVLHKVGKLTDEEKEIIRQHLSIGAKILEPMKFFKSITTLIFHHHEWYNGHGYPHGLAGDLIPSGAQIIAIADSFDAMTTQRSYNKPRTPQEALEELRRGAGTQFNPAFVDKFIEVITQEGPQLAGYAAA